MKLWLKDGRGSWTQPVVDLNQKIVNDDGAFKARGLPVGIAIPNGTTNNFLQQLRDALRDQKDFKLEYSDPPDEDGSTLWQFSLGASSNVDQTGYFRTYSLGVTQSIIDMSTYWEKPPRTFNISVLKANLSVDTQRLEKFKIQATSVSASAGIDLVDATVGPLNFTAGVGVSAGLGVNVDMNNLSTSFKTGLGGITLGRTVGVSFMGSSISIDLGSIFGATS